MKAELSQLIALQQIDLTIRRLQAELDAIPKRRAEIEQEFEQRAFEFRALEAKRDEARQRRAQLETELSETRTRIEHADRNLMSSQNEKEYAAAIREADAARKQVSTFETQILEQMEAAETAENSMHERQPEIAIMRAEMHEQIAAFEAQTHRQAEQLSDLRAEREQLAARLPKPMSALYNRISSRIRGGVAVAEARNGSCTACHMSQRPQVMSQVRLGEEIITCDNCTRILYYAPAEPVRATS